MDILFAAFLRLDYDFASYRRVELFASQYRFAQFADSQ